MYSLKVICNIGALASSYRKNISPRGASWIKTASAYVSSLGRPKLEGMLGCLSRQMAARKPRSVVVLSKKCKNVVARSGVLTRRGSVTISIRGDEAAAAAAAADVKYAMAEMRGQILKGAVKASGGPAKI